MTRLFNDPELLKSGSSCRKQLKKKRQGAEKPPVHGFCLSPCSRRIPDQGTIHRTMSPNGHIIISNIPPFDSILKKESRDAIYQICILVLLHRPGPNGQTAFHTAVKSLFCRRTSERIPAPCSVQTGNHAKTGQKHTEPIYLCVCLKLQVFSTVLYDQPSEKGIYGLTATFLTGMTKEGGFFALAKN